MLLARDSFLHFLSDNLVSPLNVHNLRRDPENPGASKLQTNAVNVQFLDDSPTLDAPAELRVAIDVIHEDERTCVDWTKQVFDLLSTQLLTPLQDYSGNSPVPQGTNLFWNQPVRFRPVYDELYCRRGALLSLLYKL